ncbi:MAG TPA: thioesterase family protein [Solirubrobacteraceae bacterium]|nr:thioesterase family protein [Solirubrobacteraceae bacterium]
MIFRSDGDLFVPTGHARGPWDPRMQHGGAPAALMVRAMERLAPQMQLVRLTVDFLGAVPLAPVRVEAEVWRPGRRMQLVRASLSMEDGREMCRAGAVLLHRQELVGLPGDTAGPPLAEGPERGGHATSDWDGAEDAFHRTGMELRWVGGTTWAPGPGQVWFRLAHPVLDDEEPSPAMRAVAAADFGNGVSRVLPVDGWLFVNTDLTVQLHRPPRGEWVALDARTIVQPAGVGLSVSTLHDAAGPVGTGQQTLYVAPR